MNLTRDRLRSLGWISVTVLCLAMLVALTLRVNAVKSEVHSTDRSIARMQQQISFLETEFQTRSNQQALKQLNALEFGYKAPGAGQYIEGERQLAALGAAPGPNAPAPIRYASVDADLPGEGAKQEGSSLLAMVNPVSGATAAAVPAEALKEEEARRREAKASARKSGATADLGAKLATIELAEAAPQ